MKRRLAFFFAALMILSGFGVLAGETEAWSSDFSTSDGWAIIGTRWAITGGELVGTDIPRNEDNIAKHLFTDATTEEYNVTFDYKITASTSTCIGRVFVNSVNMTDSSHNAFNKWIRLCLYTLDIYIECNETGTIQASSHYTATLNTWYTVNMRRINDTGTWKAQGRIWNTLTGNWANTLVSGSWTISGARASMVGVFAAGENTGTAGTTHSVKIDNYEDHEAAAGGWTDLDIATYPLLTALTGDSYYYDVACSGTNSGLVTYSLSGNCTSWLSINSGTGNITGTAPSAKGWYNVVVKGNTTNETKWQNYTLQVYPSIHGAWNAIKNPLTTFTCAVYGGGNVYVGYMGYDGSGVNQDIWIAKYNGTNWTSPVRIDTQSYDDHGNPVLLRDGSGYIHAFYGCHETDMLYKISTNPDDITAWTSRPSPAASATYPFAFTNLINGTLYLGYRKTVVSGSDYEWVFKTSTDKGVTWSSEAKLIDVGAGYAPYPVFETYPVERSGHLVLPFVWTTHIYSSAKREDAFFAYWNLTDNHVYNITNADLGTTIDLTEQNNSCKVWESGGTETKGTHVGVNDAFVPYVVIAHEVGSTYYYGFTKWTGSSWSALTDFRETKHAQGNCAVVNYDQNIKVYLQHSHGGVRGGDIEIWWYDGATGKFVCRGAINNQSQQATAPGAYFSDPSPVAGLENNWIVMCESKDSDYSTHLRIMVWNDTVGYLVNSTKISAGGSATWPPTFTSTPVTTAKVGVLYSYAAGCNESVTWTLSADGFLSISAGGVVSGTPDHAGTYQISIKATSVAGSNSTWQNYTLTVSEPYSGGNDPYDIPGGGGPDLDHPDWAARIAGFAVILLVLIMIAAGVKMATRRKGGRGGRRRR